MKHVESMFYALLGVVCAAAVIGFFVVAIGSADTDDWTDVVNGCRQEHFVDRRFWPPFTTKTDEWVTYCDTRQQREPQ